MESVALQVLVQAGVPGVVLGWFMWRSEVRMDRLERALDRMSRTQLLALLGRPDVEPAVKEQARAILAEMPPAAPVQQFAGVGQ